MEIVVVICIMFLLTSVPRADLGTILGRARETSLEMVGFQIDVACAEFRARRGRDPESLAELEQVGLLPGPGGPGTGRWGPFDVVWAGADGMPGFTGWTATGAPQLTDVVPPSLTGEELLILTGDPAGGPGFSRARIERLERRPLTPDIRAILWRLEE